MKVLVFQHVAVEHPGTFRDFLRNDQIAWDTVELDQGEPIPCFEGYAALMAFGGPMDVWQEQEHPWLVREKEAIRRWVGEKQAPFLGVCLGHQLLAEALGGKVGLMQRPEVGVCDIKLNSAGCAAPLFQGLPASFPSLQWHGAEVTELPAGAVTLAANEYCPVQAFRVGANAYGIQCHVEQSERTVPEWGQIPEYRRALERIMGPSGQIELERAVNERSETFRSAAKTIYGNFRSLMGAG
jgi:GMP synthase-like glutamine amidotransferase